MSVKYYMFIALLVLSNTLFLSLYIWLPATRHVISGEDKLVENLSAIVFFATFLFGIAFVSLYGTRCRNKAAISFVSIVGLIGGLDELSWGERIFSLGMLDIKGFHFDALHDIFNFTKFAIQVIFLKLYFINWFIPIVLLVVALLVFIFLIWQYRWKISNLFYQLIGLLPSREARLLFSIFAVSLSVAIAIDLHLLETELSIVDFIEELLEFDAALALLFCGLSVANTD